MPTAALALGLSSVVLNASVFASLPKPEAPPLVRTATVFKDVVGVLNAKTSYSELAALLHSKGVSVYYSPTSPEVVFTQKQIRDLAADTTKRDFGTSPGSGKPINITGDQFFFGLSHTAVDKGVGPLPDWTKITAATSTRAFDKPIVTSWESGAHIPTKFSGKPYWAVGYKGTTEADRFASGEVRVVFDVDAGVKGKPYRIVALVLAATYSP